MMQPLLSGKGLPLTEAQQEVWLASQMDETATLAFNEGGTLTLRGSLDKAALESALRQLVARHGALRGCFSADGQWMQILDTVAVPLPEFDISADPQRLLAEHERTEITTPFDLEHGPLIRWTLLRESDTVHHLLRTAHHIAVDGWSASLLLHELGELYSATVYGTACPLAAAPQYADYIRTERDFVASPAGRADLDYWLQQLGDPPETPEFPHDRPRPRERTYDAAREALELDAGLVARLRERGAAQGSSLVAPMVAAYAATLHRLTGAEDLIIAIAAAGQAFHQFPGLIGHAVNMLPLRLRPHADQPFSELLTQTRNLVLDAFDHQSSSFGGTLAHLQFERDPTKPPLISATFSLDVPVSGLNFRGLDAFYRVIERAAAIVELALNVFATESGLTVHCSYNTALYSAAMIRERLREYEQVLRAIGNSVEQPLHALPLMDADALAAAVAPPQLASPPVRLLHQWFAETASQHSQRNAVTFESSGGQDQQNAQWQSLTYGELDARSNQLAWWLQSQGVGPESLVGLYLERSLDTVVAILGVLKAGGAYLPIDTAYPPQRLSYMLKDSGSRLVLTQATVRDKLPDDVQAICLDSQWDSDIAQAGPSAGPPPSAATPDSLAYVIYTSGSTGDPKGCMITHANASRLFSSTQGWYDFNENDVWTLFHSYAFDFSVWELWGALLYGGRLVIVPHWTAREPETFYQLLADQGITVLNQTPSAFRQLIQAEADISPARELALRYVIFGGEALEFQSLRPWFERHGDGHGPNPDSGQTGPRLINMYGITETTVHVTYRPVSLADLAYETAPSLIGTPIPDLALYVLDARRQPVPVGVTGEIWVAGAGVARGYLNRPELSAERFIDDPFHAGQKLYRSGDLARRTPAGDIEYLSRADHQVKLRGFRVELGEIEAQLNRHPSVAQSFVTTRERAPGDRRLVAYLVKRGGVPSTASDLRKHLRLTLPDYMVPQYFIEVPCFQLTAHGKLDDKVLPSPFSTTEVAPARIPPRTPAEVAVAAVWSELLGVRDIGVDDRFFNLGGHSLLAVQAAARLMRQFGAKLPLRLVLMDTLAVVAAALPPFDTLPAQQTESDATEKSSHHPSHERSLNPAE